MDNLRNLTPEQRVAPAQEAASIFAEQQRLRPHGPFGEAAHERAACRGGRELYAQLRERYDIPASLAAEAAQFHTDKFLAENPWEGPQEAVEPDDDGDPEYNPRNIW